MRSARSLGSPASPRLTREEWLLAGGEVAALLLLFVVAFSGRDSYGESVKNLLTALSALAGGLGAVAGVSIAWRGLASGVGRWQRLALGCAMAFLGGYTVVHVLS